jgi:hypothetical protein
VLCTYWDPNIRPDDDGLSLRHVAFILNKTFVIDVCYFNSFKKEHFVLYRNIGHANAPQRYVIHTLLGLFRHKGVTLDVGEIL